MEEKQFSGYGSNASNIKKLSKSGKGNTMSAGSSLVAKKVVPHYLNFMRLPGGKVLMTNILGGNIVLDGKIFGKFISGKMTESEMPAEIAEQGFAKGFIPESEYTQAMRSRYFEGWKAPHVHIISLSALCRLNCVYCCASTSPSDTRIMGKETADKILDFIFSLEPERYLLEFQGGEPMMTFALLKYIVLKAKKMAYSKKKPVFFSVVTNLQECDEDKFRFLTEHNVTVCASLDGPAYVHDKNRPCGGGESHAHASYWLRRFADYAAANGTEMPNAICTVTKNSLPYPEKIVDEFLSCGLMRAQLGPVDPIGRAAAAWGKIGVSSEEFLQFYRSAINYILDLNRRGIAAYEKAALAFAKQSNGLSRPRYQNLDILYRLAYNWDGGIYGSDEARMVSNSGDNYFRLGNVHSDTFRKIIRTPLAIRLIASSLTELRQPMCSRCPSSLYCRVPPVYNYITQGSIHGNMPSNERCKLYRSIYDMLSELNSVPENAGIFRQWSEIYE
ncbi:MAG: 4Fe-4S cluster-binding domain-containing protein [Elusimicrobiales bacterium]|nr:4Fe-4S cluster-binding domain-containing protein [Elusimicrobiales bacterium]